MFPKITNYIELLSEDEVWDAVKNGHNIYVLRLKGVGALPRGGGFISDIDNLRYLIDARKRGLPIVFIIEDYIKKEEESDGKSN